MNAEYISMWIEEELAATRTALAGMERRLAAAGYRVRDLIAYGDAWYAWYMRRLAERPANVWFAMRQMIGF